MKNKLFLKLPCLSEISYNFQYLTEKLFNKKCDKRYIEVYIQKFKIQNQKMFNFLGIEVLLNNIGNDLSLTFKTSDKIGAIPIKLPYDGIVHGDLQVVPRFDSQKTDFFGELTQLLNILDFSIVPEYTNALLTCPNQLRPPLFYEAEKYISLLEKACNKLWIKFNVISKNYNYPRAGTNWEKYALSLNEPKNALKFPSTNSVLSTNHKEWRQLRYVYDIAKDIILDLKSPFSVRVNCNDRFVILDKKLENILPHDVEFFTIRTVDPAIIKDLKRQANILLQKDASCCMAWRISMSQLFEKYIQYIVKKSLNLLGGTIWCNKKISGSGGIPIWGITYLEPDIMIKINSQIFMADVKYKSNIYGIDVQSDILKEGHRADLHQILAYCSFEPQQKKIGFLFYPANKFKYKIIDYSESVEKVHNKVIICGIPFNYFDINCLIEEMKTLFGDNFC